MWSSWTAVDQPVHTSVVTVRRLVAERWRPSASFRSNDAGFTASTVSNRHSVPPLPHALLQHSPHRSTDRFVHEVSVTAAGAPAAWSDPLPGSDTEPSLPESNGVVRMQSVPAQPVPGVRDQPSTRLRIAMLGTRGVPASYGGFETAVAEVGKRLVTRGHEVTVYCRGAADPVAEYLGMSLVHMPAINSKTLETLSHTGVSTVHALIRRTPDVALLFNAANSPFLPLLRARGIPVATHMDGLEWRRAKWGGGGRRYYRVAEQMAVRWSDAIIADAQGIADYYRDEFGARSHLITYGAPILLGGDYGRLVELGLTPLGFHLVVARFEPENHVDLTLEGYLRSGAKKPLVVVGSAPHAGVYTRKIEALAAKHEGIRLIGSVWDQELLDQLYANAYTCLHGHSVGGTNPSLLRAMGAGSAVLAFDVVFNRDVLGEDGRYFDGPRQLADLLLSAEADESDVARRGAAHQRRADKHYRWDDVAEKYEFLCRQLSSRWDVSPRADGRRIRRQVSR